MIEQKRSVGIPSCFGKSWKVGDDDSGMTEACSGLCLVGNLVLLALQQVAGQ